MFGGKMVQHRIYHLPLWGGNQALDKLFSRLEIPEAFSVQFLVKRFAWMPTDGIILK